MNTNLLTNTEWINVAVSYIPVEESVRILTTNNGGKTNGQAQEGAKWISRQTQLHFSAETFNLFSLSLTLWSEEVIGLRGIDRKRVRDLNEVGAGRRSVRGIRGRGMKRDVIFKVRYRRRDGAVMEKHRENKRKLKGKIEKIGVSVVGPL